MRNAFIDELVALAHLNDHIALVVGDLGYSVVEPFAEQFPDRFINAGVAEQNMAGLAAGMASEGYHVFIYSIANFPVFRCAEQIRNDIDYHKLAVTVVAVGGGLAYGPLGYSHHAVQDYALMRMMPNTLIAAPGDPAETRACIRFLVNNPQPSYLRLGKVGEPTFHETVPIVTPGEWLPVSLKNKNDGLALLSTGTTLALAMNMQQRVQYSEYSVFSMPLWSMSTKSLQPVQMKKMTKIISIEDHLLDGGFGSWIMESLSNNADIRQRLNCVALNSVVCGLVGSQNNLNHIGGLV
jgi:transketolase